MKKILLFTGLAIIAALYFHYSGIYMDNKARERYTQFNKRDINNTILDLEQYARGIKLHLDSGDVVFYPITSALNNNNIFFSTAEKGDKVIKEPFKDTIILVKQNGIMLKYTFDKPNN